MFSEEEDLYVESDSTLLVLADSTSSTKIISPNGIERRYLDTAGSAVVQQNAMQLIKIKKTATDTDTTQVDFSLRYVDEFGQSYNTESTMCRWSTGAERTACMENVEAALEELPHNTIGNLRLEDATETRGLCYFDADGNGIYNQSVGSSDVLKTNFTTRTECTSFGTCSNPDITKGTECLNTTDWCRNDQG